MSALRELREQQSRERRDRLRLLVVDAIQRGAGNISLAAKMLGMSRGHLSDMVPMLGLVGVLEAVRREARR